MTALPDRVMEEWIILDYIGIRGSVLLSLLSGAPEGM